MIFPRSMTSRGKHISFLVALAILFFLPRHVECGYPGAGGSCGHSAILGRYCTPYEVEPLGFYALEKVLEHDVGFAYTTGESCR